MLKIRSSATGEEGYFIGEPMLVMADDLEGETSVSISLGDEGISVPTDTPISALINELRKKIGMT